MPSRIKMRPGVIYRIRYKMQGGNYQWSEYEITAKYIAEGEAFGHPAHVLSLRPLAGTQELEVANVLWIDEMPHTMPLAMPKRIGKYQEAAK